MFSSSTAGISAKQSWHMYMFVAKELYASFIAFLLFLDRQTAPILSLSEGVHVLMAKNGWFSFAVISTKYFGLESLVKARTNSFKNILRNNEWTVFILYIIWLFMLALVRVQKNNSIGHHPVILPTEYSYFI